MAKRCLCQEKKLKNKWLSKFFSQNFNRYIVHFVMERYHISTELYGFRKALKLDFSAEAEFEKNN